MSDICFETKQCTLLAQWGFFSLSFFASLTSKCFRFFNKTCDLENQKLTSYRLAHLFSLMLLWCYVNGLWNQFKPEAFMSCKLNWICLIVLSMLLHAQMRELWLFSDFFIWFSCFTCKREGSVGGFDVWKLKKGFAVVWQESHSLTSS